MVEGRWPCGPPTVAGTGALAVRPGPEVCSADGVLFGGWCLGLAVQLVESLTGRRLRAVTVGYLQPVAVGSCLRVQAEVLAAGASSTHVRVDGTADGVHVLSGTAVTGQTASGAVPSAAPPEVPPPEECPERTYSTGVGSALATLLDIRVAGERLTGPHPRALLWGRLRCAVGEEAGLAVLSDHVPYLLARALPGCRSATVSASVRLLGGAIGEWVLLDLDLVGRDDRFAVGRVTLWSDGRLVGVGEQTARLFPPKGTAAVDVARAATN